MPLVTDAHTHAQAELLQQLLIDAIDSEIQRAYCPNVMRLNVAHRTL